jgi:hypothetical protein
MTWAHHATLLAELHIVLGFGAQMVGSLAVSRCLSSCICLWSPWLLAAVLAGFESQLGDARKTRASAFLVGICLLLALLTFAFVLCRACKSNTAMARRSWCRASSYVVNFFITFAPLVYATFKVPYRNKQNEMSLLWCVGFFCLHLNGFVNFLTYFAQSRYSRSAIQAPPDVLAAQSLVVRFEDDAEACTGRSFKDDAEACKDDASTCESTADTQEDKV